MFANLSDIIKIPVAIMIGVILSAVVLIFFYEGLRLPLIGQVVDGRVSSAVKTATAGMASKYELQTAQYQLQRERELRQAADDAAASYRQQAALSEEKAVQRSQDAARDEAEAATNPDLSRPNAKDRAWLEKH